MIFHAFKSSDTFLFFLILQHFLNMLELFDLIISQGDKMWYLRQSTRCLLWLRAMNVTFSNNSFFKFSLHSTDAQIQFEAYNVHLKEIFMMNKRYNNMMDKRKQHKITKMVHTKGLAESNKQC